MLRKVYCCATVRGDCKHIDENRVSAVEPSTFVESLGEFSPVCAPSLICSVLKNVITTPVMAYCLRDASSNLLYLAVLTFSGVSVTFLVCALQCKQSLSCHTVAVRGDVEQLHKHCTSM